ncbi:MAG: metal ABC transporter permease [Methanothermobacter wolfeii]|nr:metal ABC transporter permease [Methanothermobacter wolfeii]MDI6701452.1 metal ABC transporter permease [Methanothermobacter wolfeii]MDI6842622.1 metal ABC transporter permease [Methanothermobacter wolfeii]
MMEILQYQFMRNAIVAAVLVSIACGVVGSYVVTKRIVSISGGISHAAFGGVGLGYLMGVSPVTTAIPFTVGAAISMGAVTRKTGISEDTAIGILWSAGMALGIVFINLSPGYVPDLFSYLFGNILMVTPIDLWTMLILDLIIISSAVLFEREFLALCFDEEYAEVLGVPVDTFYLYLLALVALSVVVLIKAAGIILVIALLTIPAAIAKNFSMNMKDIMVKATLTGVLTALAGLWISYEFNLSSGAIIVLLLTALFGITQIFGYLKEKNTLKRMQNH